MNVNIEPSVGHADITTKPPDKARENENGNQLNLFLYQVLPNAALRNMDISPKARSGETGMPPLALNLYYMLTAYSIGNDDLLSHRLLGHAMSILHDHAVLSASDFDGVLTPEDSEMQNQVERIRITLQPLSVEEIFRLWSGFQTQYRVSVSYEIRAILIDSTLPRKTPLPVLSRGQEDRGVASQPDLIAPFPTLESIVFPQMPSALPGDTLTFQGHDLLPEPDLTVPPEDQIDNSQTMLSFMHSRWIVPVEIAPTAGRPRTTSEITITLPDDPLNWPAGFYTVSALFKTSSGKVMRTSNEISFSLAPAILDTPPIQATRNGSVVVTLRCNPAVQQTIQQAIQGTTQTIIKAQSVALLLGDQQSLFVFPNDLSPQQDLSFPFPAKNIPSGDYFVRLRVDGVDSLLVDRSTTPPTFKQSQKVTVP
jgi:hypothetical protein